LMSFFMRSSNGGSTTDARGCRRGDLSAGGGAEAAGANEVGAAQAGKAFRMKFT
jgi:hypothetical protein